MALICSSAYTTSEIKLYCYLRASSLSLNRLGMTPQALSMLEVLENRSGDKGCPQSTQMHETFFQSKNNISSLELVRVILKLTSQVMGDLNLLSYLKKRTVQSMTAKQATGENKYFINESFNWFISITCFPHHYSVYGILGSQVRGRG